VNAVPYETAAVGTTSVCVFIDPAQGRTPTLLERSSVVHWLYMQTLVVDTNGVVKKLEEHGFSRTQAEGITEALKELDTSMFLIAQGALIVALIQYFK
jgi:hypothetical protein